MGKFENSISAKLQKWIKKQKIFFVSTAPLSATGHINCSPKGLDSFRIIDDKTVVYEDLTGSGAETIAHVNENKRIVIMFCAFEGAPLIVRLYGEGEIITKYEEEFSTIQQFFTPRSGVRAYIKINLTRVSDSCGYSVPLYEFKQDRDVLDKWFDRKGVDGLVQYQKENNQISLDGLKALEF
jgi:hypothetical protein